MRLVEFKKCKSCNSTKAYLQYSGPHVAIKCGECDKWQGWRIQWEGHKWNSGAYLGQPLIAAPSEYINDTIANTSDLKLKERLEEIMWERNRGKTMEIRPEAPKKKVLPQPPVKDDYIDRASDNLFMARLFKCPCGCGPQLIYQGESASFNYKMIECPDDCLGIGVLGPDDYVTIEKEWNDAVKRAEWSRRTENIENFFTDDGYKDPRWQRKRLEIMQRDGFRCIACGDSTSLLHVHHKIYGPTLWGVDDTQLQTLCCDCHSLLGRHPRGGVWWERIGCNSVFMVEHCPYCKSRKIIEHNTHRSCGSCKKEIVPLGLPGNRWE